MLKPLMAVKENGIHRLRKGTRDGEITKSRKSGVVTHLTHFSFKPPYIFIRCLEKEDIVFICSCTVTWRI